MHRNTVTRNWIRPPTIPRVHPDSVRGNTVTFRGMKLADIFVSRYKATRTVHRRKLSTVISTLKNTLHV